MRPQPEKSVRRSVVDSAGPHSLLSSSFLRTPGVLAEELLLLALRHFEADSLVAECSDSASAAPALPALMVALLCLGSPDKARRMTARSGVGRARREGPRDAGAAAGGEHGGEGGREGLGRGGREDAGACSEAPESTSAESTTLKVLESQDSFTYRVSLSPESGNGAAPSRCFTCPRKKQEAKGLIQLNSGGAHPACDLPLF